VKGSRNTKIAKNRIGLGVFIDEGIANQLMVRQELLFGHGSSFLEVNWTNLDTTSSSSKNCP
jgi:hypothetical protein